MFASASKNKTFHLYLESKSIDQILMKYIFLIALSLFAVSTHAQTKSSNQIKWIDFNKNGKLDVYEDPNEKTEKRIAHLLSLMTVEEKTCQMATLYGYGRVLKDQLPTPAWKNEIWKDGIANIDEQLNGVRPAPEYTYPFSKHAEAINKIQKWFIEETRLGIPVDFSNEGIHGLTHTKATPLPSPIAIGSTWNKDLVFLAGSIVGREAKALGYTNIYAPILDVARDPRWGRVLETYGENPFLIAELGKQMTLGIQDQGVAATLKHFAVYSIPKGGRDGNARTDPHVAPREMHQIHLYPFKRVIQEANPMGIMSSYNDWDGEPVTASKYFLTELLREKYGFKGYVVSDSEAVEYVSSKHHVAEDYKEAVRQVVEAGLNVRTNFTPPQNYILPLRQLIKEGKISMKTIDSRVADVLRVKFELGLFDEPYVKDPKAADIILNPKNTSDFVLDMAKQSLVLLKNSPVKGESANLLPLDLKKTKQILVTGPLAAETKYALSRYGPNQLAVTSILDGIKNYAGSQSQVNYVKGCEVVDANWPESELFDEPLDAKEQMTIDEAVAAAKLADVIIAVLGEDEKTTGESKSRTDLGLPGRQLHLLKALHATGKPIVLVLVNGQPLTINWPNKYVNSILETWFSNPRVGEAVAQTLFGDYNPGGKLPMTFPKSTGQIELNFPFKPASQAGQPGTGQNGIGKTRVLGSLYPFGFGLSYTTFQYSDLEISSDTIKNQQEITASVKIKNIGDRKGDEIVQLYLKDVVSSVTTYEYDLRGFDRISLLPNESKTVTFTIKPDDMALLDKNYNWSVEPGKFVVMVGSSSEDIKLKKEFLVLP